MKEGFILQTYVRLSIFEGGNDKILEEAFEVCRKYEELFSTEIPSSDIYKINSGADEVVVGHETIELLKEALIYAKLSEGVLDLSMGAVTSLWNFDDGYKKIPSYEELEEALDSVNYNNIKIEENKVRLLNPNTKIDLGAFAKGFIADKIKDYLVENSVESAIINLGGNILVIGEKQNNETFKIGLQSPFKDRGEDVFATIAVKDMAVVTSGVYEKYFHDEDNKFYHHIISSKTGFPENNEILSVTIINKSALKADALSTLCFLIGKEKSLELVESLDGTEAIIFLEDENILKTSGIGKSIPYN